MNRSTSLTSELHFYGFKLSEATCFADFKFHLLLNTLSLLEVTAMNF